MANNTPIDPELLRRYLQTNPAFLAELLAAYPDLLDGITQQHLSGNAGIVDFQRHRINKLKQQLDHHTGLQEELIDTSRSNMQSQLQVNQCILSIVGCQSLEGLLSYVSREMAEALHLDAAILCVESREQAYPYLREPVMSVDRDAITSLFSDGSQVILAEPTDSTRPFFGPAADLIQSQALIRLPVAHAHTALMLALGDRDPAWFHEGQATHLLRFLGDALALRLDQFMADSESSTGTVETPEQWSSPETP
jgi:uncharacterized protein YigA (DUF484 family)